MHICLVVPANAGTHAHRPVFMGSRLRENDKRLRIESRARSYPSPYGTDKGGRSRPSSGPARSPQRLSALARHLPSPRLRGEGARLVPRIDKGEGDAQQSCPSPHPSPRSASLGGAREQSGQDWLRSWRSSGAFLIVLPSQTTPTQAIFMIAVLPQTGHRQRNASEVAGSPQSQFASECFMDWHSPCG